jgi:GT2 family glycosyltransferase
MPKFRTEDLAVVIPTRERWPTLRKCLDSLRRQTVAGFEVVVAVDGDDAPIPSDLDATVVVRPQAGPSAARNAGVSATQRRLIFFLGDDVFLEPGAIAAHLDRHNDEPAEEVAVLGRVGWHADVAGGRINRWLDWSGTQFDYRVIEAEPTDDLGYGRFYTSNVSLKKALFDRAGGFDEEFPYAAYEDIELGWRLDECGLVLRYEPGAEAVHLHRYDWPAIERRFQAVARSERMMVRKHPGFEPFFLNRVKWLLDAEPPSRHWTRLVDLVPERLAALRRLAEERADRWYCHRLAGPYVDAWEGERGLEELREYLGDAYDHERLRNHHAEVDAEEMAAGDEAAFYRTSEAYLYDLTVFGMSGTKAPYRQVLRRLVPAPARLLDYGCGIGFDGLQLAEAGYEVAFADFDNPSTRFLRWRLERRGIEA